MAKTRNQNHVDDDASSTTKRLKTFGNNDMALWSNLNHDLLFLVMKQLGVVDFLAFSGVCKSWRSFAVCNKNTFMASLPPMSMRFSTDANEKDSYCHLADFEGRSFKTILPHSAGRICFGSTCGYLVLYARETRDFWLVNPITRHELHFPDCPLYVIVERTDIRPILVFSPSIFEWVFVVVHRKLWCNRPKSKMLFCIAGKRRWNHVSSTTPCVLDLQYFKGKIYTVHIDCSIRELRLDPKSKCKWELLEIMIFLKPGLLYPELVSACENLYMINPYTSMKKVVELDFGVMKWVLPEKTLGEYAFFTSRLNHFTAIKPLSSGDPLTKYKSYDYFLDEDKSRKCMLFDEWMWYFPDDCLNVNVIS